MILSMGFGEVSVEVCWTLFSVRPTGSKNKNEDRVQNSVSDTVVPLHVTVSGAYKNILTLPLVCPLLACASIRAKSVYRMPPVG